MTRKKTRIRGLDGLRTLALTGVLLYHAFPRFMPGGFFGVDIFFVISGFLTAYASVSRGRMGVLPYYRRRLVRLYPALVLVIFITVEFLALADKFRLINAHEEVASILLGFNNYWQISKQADYFANLSNTSAFTHLWYIAVLIQFELIWPWLYLAGRRSGRGATLLAGLTVISLLIMPIRALFTQASQTVLYYSTDTRIHALLIGALLGWKTAERKQTKKRMKPLPALLFGLVYIIVTVILFLKVSGTDPAVCRYGLVLYALFTAMMLWSCVNSGNLGRLLDLPPFQKVSSFSYEMYLWQYPVLFLCSLKGWTAWWMYVLQIIVIIILSIWTHVFVEHMQRRLIH